MRQSWSSIVVGFVCVLALTLAVTTGAYAQAAPAQEASAQQAAPPMPSVVYKGDAAVILNYIQNDKAADFEDVMAKVKEALQKSDKPERKQQAEGWTVFKSPDPSGKEGVTVYVTLLNPVVKGANYYLAGMLQEAFPQDYVALYNKYSASYTASGAKLVPINLNSVITMK
jgi:hypothetical protein